MRYFLFFFALLSGTSGFAQDLLDVEHSLFNSITFSRLQPCAVAGMCSDEDRVLYDILKAEYEGDLPLARKIFRAYYAEHEADESTDEMTFSFASLAVTAGKVLEAEALFKSLVNKAGVDSIIQLASKVELRLLDITVKSLEQKETLFLASSGFKPEKRLELLIRLAIDELNERSLNMLKRGLTFAAECDNPDLLFAYYSNLSIDLLSIEDMEGVQYYELAKLYFNRMSEFAQADRRLRFLQLKKMLHSRQGDYAQLLETARESVYLELDVDTITAEYIDTLSYIHPNSTISYALVNYASANLFQTRLGKGTKPVIKAFNIYNKLSAFSLAERMGKVRDLTAGKYDASDYDFLNPLVIGTYLYQQEGDWDYVDKSLVNLDGSVSYGLFYWVNARRKMRGDAKFAERMNEVEQQLGDVAAVETVEEFYASLEDLQEAKETVFESYPDFKRTVLEDFKFETTDIQDNILGDSESILAFYQNQITLYRLFLSKDTATITPMHQVYGEIIPRARTLIKNQKNRNLSEAEELLRYELYDLMLGDIDSLLKPEIHIVGNGMLDDFPFSLLRKDSMTDQPEYLGLEHAISRQFSISTMKLLQELELQPDKDQPLAFAPQFAGDEIEDFIALRSAGFSLPPLKYAEKELDNLRELSGGSYYSGRKATKEAFIAEGPNHGIVHLATHAVSNAEDGLASRIYFLDEEGEITSLSARDIGEQTLNARLVTLSACETGQGSQNIKEGTIGLTRAFIAAGARTVLSSSWAVEDKATAELMESFYAEIAKGVEPHVALREARLAYVKAHPNANPADWASFEVYGSTKPIEWNKSQSWFASFTEYWWAWGLGLLTLITVVVVGQKRFARG